MDVISTMNPKNMQKIKPHSLLQNLKHSNMSIFVQLSHTVLTLAFISSGQHHKFTLWPSQAQLIYTVDMLHFKS